MSMPRSVVLLTWLCLMSAITQCVTIPSRTPEIVQPSIIDIALSIANEMTMPCTHGPRGADTWQSSIITAARRTWMPSSVTPDHVHAVEHHVVGVLDVDAVLAADRR